MADTTTSSAGAAEPTSAGATTPTTYRGMRIRQLQAEIADLQTAVTKVLTTGKSYTLSNSHAVTRADVADIQSELAAKKQELSALLTRGQYQPIRLEPTKFF